MSYFSKQTAEKIKAAYAKISPMYTTLSDASWNEIVSGLQHGQAVPAKGKIYDETRKSEFKAFVREQRAEAMEALKDYRSSIDNKIAAAPSDEALRAVQAFSMRVNQGIMSKESCADEADRIMSLYGENYSVYMALYDIAAAYGVHTFKKHGLNDEVEKLNNLESNLNSFFEPNRILNQGGVFDGLSSMLNAVVDQSLPAE